MRIENKEIKNFLEKNNNSSRTILKKSIESSKKLIESSKRLNERRRMNESWRKKLKKIETLTTRILSKESRKSSFLDEISISKTIIEDDSSNEDIIEIHSIVAASFNTLSRQKDV